MFDAGCEYSRPHRTFENYRRTGSEGIRVFERDQGIFDILFSYYGLPGLEDGMRV